MFIIPVSTDVHDGTMRLAAIQIMAACILMHVFLTTDRHKQNEAVHALIGDIDQRIEQQDARRDSVSRAQNSRMSPADSAEYQQRRAEEAMRLWSEGLQEIRGASWSYKLSLKRKPFNILNLLTHMFMHGDWLHLLGNMLFFYVCGVAMEKYWGFWRFWAVYLVSGVVAALAFMVSSAMAGSDPSLPLLGASGAIAGAMGAFLVTHFKHKVKMFWTVFFVLRGHFFLPAWLYLLFWFGQQLVNMTSGAGQQSGIAYSAHYVGFLVGAVLGVLVRSEDDAAAAAPVKTAAFFGAAADALAEQDGAAGDDGVYAGPDRRVGGGAAPEVYDGPPRSFGGGAVAGAAAAAAPPQPARQSSPVDEGFRALDRGDAAGAASKIAVGIDHLLKLGDQRAGELTAALTRTLQNADTLNLPAAHVFQWGKQLVALRRHLLAISCFDLASRTAPSDHLRKNSMMAAAAARIQGSIQISEAREILQQVVADDGQGMFGKEAADWLQKLDQAAQTDVRGF